MPIEKNPAEPDNPVKEEDKKRHPRKPVDDKRTVPGHEGAQYGNEKGRPKDSGREGA